MMDPKTRALETCLQQLRAGAGLEGILAGYPQWADELRPALEAAQAAQFLASGLAVPAGAQELSREQLLQAAARSETVSAHPARGGRPRSGLRSCLAVLALLLALGLAGYGAATASARALPGERLYPVKFAFERARLLLAPQPGQRLALEQAFDRERLEEVVTLTQDRRTGPVNFTAGLETMGANRWQVGGLPVLIPEDAQIVGQVQPGIFVRVRGELLPDGSIRARRIEAREYELSGVLQAAETGRLSLAGIAVKMTADTLVQGEPEVGKQARVSAFQLLDGSLQARLVEVD